MGTLGHLPSWPECPRCPVPLSQPTLSGVTCGLSPVGTQAEVWTTLVTVWPELSTQGRAVHPAFSRHTCTRMCTCTRECFHSAHTPTHAHSPTALMSPPHQTSTLPSTHSSSPRLGSHVPVHTNLLAHTLNSCSGVRSTTRSTHMSSQYTHTQKYIN